MAPWFDEFPLDFGRGETRQAERLLIAGYPRRDEALRLAQNIGLDPAYLVQDGSPAALMHNILEEARKSDRLLQLIGEALGDPSKAALHKPLRALIAGYESVFSVAAMRWRPSLATLAGLPALSASFLVEGKEGTPPKPLPGLEKTIIAAAGFFDPAVQRRSIADAEVRVARIDIGGKPMGTGFLVGDSLMLTNWHVVEDGVEGAKAAFDYKVAPPGEVVLTPRPVAFAADWREAYSLHDKIPVEQSADGPQPGTWDFALVRLAEPVGAQSTTKDPTGQHRGFYGLDGGFYNFDPTEPLFIMGHPEGHPMQLSMGTPANAKSTKNSNRVRYWTNT